MRSESPSSSDVELTSAAHTRTSLRSRPVDLGAEVDEQLEHRLDVADARHVAEHDRLGREQGRREQREGGVLVALGADRAGERHSALDDEELLRARACHDGKGSHQKRGARSSATRAGTLQTAVREARGPCPYRASVGSAMDGETLARDRPAALALLQSWTESEALRRHAYAVEAAVRAYARERGADEDAWGNVALLHDFDYERHPTLDQHPQDGAPHLRELGYPEWFVRAVLSHANHLQHVAQRESDLERVLFACDELAGFVHACGLVRPEGLSDARAAQRAQEAQAEVVRGGRQPRRRLRGRRGARASISTRTSRS